MADDEITIRLESLREGVDAEAFLDAMRVTIAALDELNKSMSEYGAVNLEWRIVNAGLNSPLFATLHPYSTSKENGHYGTNVIDTFVRGMNALEMGDDPPALFNESALRSVAALGRAKAKGVLSIDFTVGTRKASATKKVVEHANNAASRLELERVKRSGRYVDYGTVEGRLRDLMGGKNRLVLVDEWSGKTISCYFTGDENDKKARKAWKGRVAFTGEITYDRATNDPIEVKVDEIRLLRDSSQLPQLEDFTDLDLTGGLDSADLIMAYRDDN